jgi:class 3 adenylate cyclase
MVPKHVAEKLERGEPVPPKAYEFCAMFLSDIEHFTAFARKSKDPLVVFNMLDRLYSVMDLCVQNFPTLYKVETIGDAYMVVAGISEQPAKSTSGIPHAESYSNLGTLADPLREQAHRDSLVNDIVQFALLVNECVLHVPLDSSRGVDQASNSVRIRIGLHCGAVVTGLTGSVTPRFSLFGDTVNMTARIETSGQTRRVHISEDLAKAITASSFSDLYHLVKCEDRKDIKGIGLVQTFFVEPSAKLQLGTVYREAIAKARSTTESLLRVQGGLSALAPVPAPQLRKLSSSVSLVSMDAVYVNVDSALAATELVDANEGPGARKLTALVGNVEVNAHVHSLIRTAEPRQEFGDLCLPSLDNVACPFEYEAMARPDFDPRLVLASSDRDISAAVRVLFRGALGGSLALVKVRDVTFDYFVTAVSMHYHSDVPYHNYHHAFMVLQYTCVLLEAVKLRAKRQISLLDTFSLLLSALVHDLDHRGLNNQFHVNSGSKLALLFNDRSVLEVRARMRTG